MTTDLIEERLNRIRRRINSDIALDAAADRDFLMDELDRIRNTQTSEDYRFNLIHDAVVDAEGLDCA